MSDRNKYRFNLVAWVAVSLTLCGSSVRGLWYLSEVAHDVRQVIGEVKGIRDDVKAVRGEVESLKDRTTRLEERVHVSGDFYDHTKGGNR